MRRHATVMSTTAATTATTAYGGNGNSHDNGDGPDSPTAPTTLTALTAATAPAARTVTTVCGGSGYDSYGHEPAATGFSRLTSCITFISVTPSINRFHFSYNLFCVPFPFPFVYILYSFTPCLSWFSSHSPFYLSLPLAYFGLQALEGSVALGWLSFLPSLLNCVPPSRARQHRGATCRPLPASLPTRTIVSRRRH